MDKERIRLIAKKILLELGIVERSDNIYDENSSAFLKGILLGDSSNIDDEIKENIVNKYTLDSNNSVTNSLFIILFF